MGGSPGGVGVLSAMRSAANSNDETRMTNQIPMTKHQCRNCGAWLSFHFFKVYVLVRISFSIGI
jgi:hypothetical protein